MANFGIDLGTTNSLIAVFEGDSAIIVENSLGEKLTPSVVGLDEDGNVVVGRVALQRLISHPDKTVSIFKPHTGSGRQFYLGDKKFSVEELSALVLRQLKQDAENAFGEGSIEHCVISVPAYFTNSQRNSVKNAAAIAGLPVEKIISEPTAAALAYGMHRWNHELQFLVLDLGGGTFDVSLMEYFEGVFNIRASAGDGHLGGEDFSNRIVDSFLQMQGIKRTDLNAQEYQSLRSQCENLKRQLSSRDTVTHDIKIKERDYRFGLNNEMFADMCQDLMSKIKDPIVRVLKDTHTRLYEINQIVLVGGSSRMQIFNNLVNEYFPDSEIYMHEPDTAIALGACLQAEMDAGGDSVAEYVVTDVTPFTLGIDVHSSELKKNVYLPIIERNSPVPISKRTQVYKMSPSQSTIGIDVFQGESLNPQNNIRLGSVEVPTPWPDTKQAVDVQFTYDDNGIIHVDVSVEKLGIHQSIIIKNKSIVLSDSEIEAQKLRIQELKILPAEKAENRLILAKLERLYEEFIGADRDLVYDVLRRFYAALNSDDQMTIHRERIAAENYLAQFRFGE